MVPGPEWVLNKYLWKEEMKERNKERRKGKKEGREEKRRKEKGRRKEKRLYSANIYWGPIVLLSARVRNNSKQGHCTSGTHRLVGEVQVYNHSGNGTMDEAMIGRRSRCGEGHPWTEMHWGEDQGWLPSVGFHLLMKSGNIPVRFQWWHNQIPTPMVLLASGEHAGPWGCSFPDKHSFKPLTFSDCFTSLSNYGK